MSFKSLSYQQVIKKARKAGFVLRRRTGGTHEIWWNEVTKKTCVIPHHHEVKPGTIKSIIKQMGLTDQQFDAL